MESKRICVVGLTLFVWALSDGVAKGEPIENATFYPKQAKPRGIITLPSMRFASSGPPRPQVNNSAEHMLAQSLAGLAAKAVNEGRFDEMAYITLWDKVDFVVWKEMLLKRTGVKDLGSMTVWQLIERWRDKGVFDGYILYSWDRSEGPLMTSRKGMNKNSNVAASLAGPLRGLMISEALEPQARASGLQKLADVRDKDERWAFDTYRDRYDRKRVLLQDPGCPYNRAIAIAHNVLTIYGQNDLTTEVYKWMHAPGLVMGWNVGDEGGAVNELSRWGHVISASNWAINLPAMSIGAADLDLPKLHHPDMSAANSSNKPLVSFMLTDGDNLQWILGGFVFNPPYWANPNLREVPVSFTLPLADMIEVAPDAYLYLQKDQPESVTIAAASGYWYPDKLGEALPDEKRKAILRFQARRIERTFQATGAHSLMLICMSLRDEWTHRAFQILANEAPSLRYGVVLQYAPYEAEEGRVCVVKRADGSTVPFISAAYAIWHNNPFPRADNPTKIAAMLKERLKSGASFPIWITVHAWSVFRDSADHTCAVSAAAWCAKLIDDVYHIASNEDIYRAIAGGLKNETGWVTPR
jgi:hypothetical protein